MSKNTPAAWTPDEIRQMQEDWWRTGHNLTQVAELHACDRADVITALGLTEADIKRSKKARRVRWETVNPEKAAEFVRLLEGGITMTAACALPYNCFSGLPSIVSNSLISTAQGYLT